MSAITDMRAEEKAVLALRGLYEGFGYNKYKVSQFEEYGFYLKYKSFLGSDKLLSFTDLDGRLMALKPDISLSIIKNAATDGETQRLYYHENVYRESQSSGSFKEISQMGLEYIGNITDYAICETVLLAKRSLCAISEDHVLEISHLGYAEGLMEAMGITGGSKQQLLAFVAAKSLHEIQAFVSEHGVKPQAGELLCRLCTLCGDFDEIIVKAEQLCQNNIMREAVRELKIINEAISAVEETNLRLDFTLLNDTEFYDGILMAGYISGVPQAVLSGGRYDSTVRKLGKGGGAIGFAVYLSLLEYMRRDKPICVNAALINNGESPAQLLCAAQQIINSGKSVVVADKTEKNNAIESFCLTEGVLKKC